MSDIAPPQIVLRPIDSLIPYARNARTHSPEQIAQIKASLVEFGWTNCILADDTGIVAGHGRVLAATELYKHGQSVRFPNGSPIPIGMVPVVDCSGWGDAQRRAYILADNKLALNAGWDEEMLRLELVDLKLEEFDLDLTGFGGDELDQLLADLTADDHAADGADEDDAPEAPEIPISQPGDIWLLGNHRVMCGDSTSFDDVEKLLDGAAIDLIFTDPPYNVAFNGRSGKHEVIKNDKLSKKDFDEFITEVCQTIMAVNAKCYYVWCNWNFYGVLQDKLDYKACIVWAKNVFGMGNGYRHQHEFCLFNGKIDAEIKNESDLWEVAKDRNYVHPTQKPVALSVRAFGNHVKLLNVLDLFGGSGSTLIGAEQTGRKAFLMELDQKYVDVIVRRWEKFTGRKAVHATTGETFPEA